MATFLSPQDSVDAVQHSFYQYAALTAARSPVPLPDVS